jgi:glycolate oxidase FAD binding subunit
MADLLRRFASNERTISLFGFNSKRLMAGPLEVADECITTTALSGVLEYEHQDLTVSVEAGLPWRDLTKMLAVNRQTVPLDPPFGARASVGGVVASNSSGPRRRLYGTARDMVIGMQFATLQGKVVQTGGMVVKNVAGLDMGKLMIGSFGTLAAILVVNFKVSPAPDLERTFLLRFDSCAGAVEARDRVLKSVLQPSAIDLLNPAAGASVSGEYAWTLAMRAGGNQAAMDRYGRELAEMGEIAILEDVREREFWDRVQEFAPTFLDRHADGAGVRVSCTLKELSRIVDSMPGPAIARAGSGVVYGYFDQWAAAAGWMADAVHKGWKPVVEYAPENRKHTLDLWPSPGADLKIMADIKKLYDPGNVLNRGRLYRRL